MATPGDEMARNLIIHFDGPALDSNRMPVRDLAPSLLAMGDLFQRVQEVIDPMAPPVSLEVRAFGDSHSFEAFLHLSPQDVINLMSSAPAVAIGNLIGIVCNSGHGLFALIKWLRGKRVVRRDELQQGTTRIEDNHGNVFIADTMVFNAFDDPRTRGLANDVVEPLRKPGVHEMRIEQEQTHDSISVQDDEAGAFEAALEGQSKTTREEERALTVVGPVFKRANKWRFSDGVRDDIWALITDEALWQKVAAHNDLYGAGDVLTVRAEIVETWNAAGSLVDSEMTILEVLNHEPGHGPHPELFGPGQDEGES